MFTLKVEEGVPGNWEEGSVGTLERDGPGIGHASKVLGRSGDGQHAGS